MSNYHFREKKMSLKAKGLLSWMLSLPDNWDYSIKGMCKCHKDGEDAITSALKELQSFGYLEVVKLMPGTIIENSDGSTYTLNRIDYDYVIYEKPINPQDTGFQCTENQATENQATENPYQINTKEPNTKEPNTNKKSTGAGALSKNHSQVYKKRESLNDDLESGEIIDEHIRERKKKSEYDKCLDEIKKRYFNSPVQLLLQDHLEWSYKSKDPKRIRTLAIYKRRLDELDKLDGDKIAIVQQSINRQWHCFYELQESKSKLSNKREELSDVIKVTTQEEVQNNIVMLRESGKELF